MNFTAVIMYDHNTCDSDNKTKNGDIKTCSLATDDLHFFKASTPVQSVQSVSCSKAALLVH